MARLFVIGFVVLFLTGPVLADFCVVAPPVAVPTSSFYVGPAVALRPVPVAAFYAPAVVPPPPEIGCPAPLVPAAVAVPTPAPAAWLPVPSPRRTVATPRINPELVPNVSEFRDVPRTARSLALETSFYRASYFDPSATPRSPDKIVLTLRNASGKSAMVWLNGVRYLLVDGQSLQREVGRDFTWQVEGREKETGRVPAGQQGMNLVIER